MSSEQRPLVLVTNDDGIHAIGIDALARAAESIGDVLVVAPDREQSAVGHGISIDKPLRRIQLREHANRVAVTGTPADCVYFALAYECPRRPDIVLSGVNRGNNIGEDVFYSGTVAAAIEAALHDVPSIAVSLEVGGDLDLAARMACELAAEVLERGGIERRTFLNLNFPAALRADWQTRVTSLGHRSYGCEVAEHRDPRGRPYWWIGAASATLDRTPDTDVWAIDRGDVALTQVRLDLDDPELLRRLEGWGTVSRWTADGS